MTHQYYLRRTVLCCMTLNCSLEHLAYVFYLLFQIIRSLSVIVDRMLMFAVLNSETSKACSSDLNVMIRVLGTKAIEAQCQKRAVVFNEARVSGNKEDKQRFMG